MRTLAPVLSLLIAACGDEPNTSADAGRAVVDAADDTTADTETARDVDAVEPYDEGSDPGLEPVDIVPHARIDASSVRRIVLWPREDQNAAATVRDDATDTGWQPEPNAPSSLCVDWQPTLGGPLWIDHVEVDGAGLAGEVVVTRHRACGLEPIGAPVAGTFGAPIAVSGRAGAITFAFDAAPSLQVDALRVISTDDVRGPLTRAAVAHDAPLIDGVIEGFYGVPWSWRERTALVELIGASGMATYVYAPKSDPLHRARWREVYNAAFTERFGELSSLARERGVRVFFGLSPFIDFDEDADYDTLLAKLRAFADDGTRDFVLLADDIEGDIDRPVDGDLAALHRRVVERLLNDLADVDELTLWFVPTVYSDARLDAWEQGAAYLAEIGLLDARVEILWTGTDTFATSMTAADMERVSAALGREPFIWDNFWANDAGDGFFGRIMLGAFAGRDAALLDVVTGIAHNPMIQGALSRLAFGTYAAWRSAPNATADELRAASAALEAELAFGEDPALVPLLVEVMEVFDGAANVDPSYADFDSLPARLANIDSLDDVDLAELLDILGTLARLATLGSEVRHSAADVDLVDELVFPLEKARLQGEAALWQLMAMRERLAGRDAGTFAAVAARLTEAATHIRFNFSGDTAGQLAAAAEDLVSLGVAPAAWMIEGPDGCSLADGIDWRLGDGDFVVAGLPEATVSDGTVAWTPDHAGVYRVALVGVRGGDEPSFGVWVGDVGCW